MSVWVAREAAAASRQRRRRRQAPRTAEDWCLYHCGIESGGGSAARKERTRRCVGAVVALTMMMSTVMKTTTLVGAERQLAKVGRRQAAFAASQRQRSGLLMTTSSPELRRMSFGPTASTTTGSGTLADAENYWTTTTTTRSPVSEEDLVWDWLNPTPSSASLTEVEDDDRLLFRQEQAFLTNLVTKFLSSPSSLMPSTTATATATAVAVPTTVLPEATRRPINREVWTITRTLSSSTFSQSFFDSSSSGAQVTPRNGVNRKFTAKIALTPEEQELFDLLREVTRNLPHGGGPSTTLRVAGGWVRDKLLATDEFRPQPPQPQTSNENGGGGGVSRALERLTSKLLARTSTAGAASTKVGGPSMGRQGTKVVGTASLEQAADAPAAVSAKTPVDIDIALDNMLGREFAEQLNEWLSQKGRQRLSVGVVLKNPEKSKHLETATLKIGSFWVDLVNLRAEEYANDSRIPEDVRIGTPLEDAHRRDLTINALFYNVNDDVVEDWTGRGLDDLHRGIVATPLQPLTTLLDDPLRVLRSVRFAARLRFQMDDDLTRAAQQDDVRTALEQKVSRERVGGEVDLMFRSRDPMGAMKLLLDLNLATTVFHTPQVAVLERGLDLLTTVHNHLQACAENPPAWCAKPQRQDDDDDNQERLLLQDDEARRLLWYASFLKPFRDAHAGQQKKKKKKSALVTLLVDDLKRPVRDAQAMEKIVKGADEFTRLVQEWHGVVRLVLDPQKVDPWNRAMDLRWELSQVLEGVESLWRAALLLSLGEALNQCSTIPQRRATLQRYNDLAMALIQLDLVGIWLQKPLVCGAGLQEVLPHIPCGPEFRQVVAFQKEWMVRHPGASQEELLEALTREFSQFG